MRPKSLRLDSHHHERSGGKLIEIKHDRGLYNPGPPRSFSFGYRDAGGHPTDLVIAEGPLGHFSARFTYKGYYDAPPDRAIASVHTDGTDAWEIEVTGVWRGDAYDMTFYAKLVEDTPPGEERSVSGPGER